jgi:hypothetical protein
MNESYRRALTAALERMERDLIGLQRSCAAPADGALYRELLASDSSTMLTAIEQVLHVLRESGRALGMQPRAVSLSWRARAQALSYLISVDDLEPARVGISYGRLGEPAEVARITDILLTLSGALSGLRDACASAEAPREQ